MRVQPRPLITIGIAVGYQVIVGITWAVMKLDSGQIGDSTSTVVKGMIIPIGVGAIFIAGITSYLGWWGPALHEAMRMPRWMWAVPVLAAIPGIGHIMGGAPLAGRSLGYLAALAVGTLLVGFSEETLWRGTGLVGLRGGFREPIAWALSCLLFGLVHATNALFGRDLGDTIQQVIFAILAGTVFYVTRRVSGTLILCIVLHAWIDFTVIAFAKAGDNTAWHNVATVQFIAYIVAIIGTVIVLRRGAKADTEAVGAHATA